MSLQFFCEECVTVQVTYPAHDFSLLSFFFWFLTFALERIYAFNLN